MPRFRTSRLARRRALLGRDNPIRSLYNPIQRKKPGGEYRKVGHLYKDPRWKILRNKMLEIQPVCVVCEERASVSVDHIVRHRGDPELFFMERNLQALCKECHEDKTRQEKRLPLLENKLKAW